MNRQESTQHIARTKPTIGARGRAGGVKAPAAQRGVVLVLVTVAMLSLLGIAGLAMDGGHMILNKARLQNAVDAAALWGAKVLDETEDLDQARTAAQNTFMDNANASGNQELADALSAADIVVEFADTLTAGAFSAAGGADPQYVKVRVDNMPLESWLIQVVGFDNKRVSASAVAGPSPVLEEVCGIAPMMACGSPDTNPAEGDYYGYMPMSVQVLKTGSKNSSSDSWNVGPGNFQLLDLDAFDNGGAGIRDALAGDFDVCLTEGDTVPTKPGNTVGPVEQGLNSRMGDDQNGPVKQVLPDIVIRAPSPEIEMDEESGELTADGAPVESASDLSYHYDMYEKDAESCSSDSASPYYSGTSCNLPDGKPERRILKVPIGKCDGTENGAGSVEIYGFGCFFILQPVKSKGNEAEVYGQFVGECEAEGAPGPDPGETPGPYIIQLYKDPDSRDS